MKSISNSNREVNDMEHATNTYSSKDVAKRLSVEPVTIRKYSQMLEEQGYSFKKDNNNWRQYSEEDIVFLEYICNMRDMGKSLDESVQHVASLYRLNLSIAKPDTALQEPKEQLMNFIQNQQEFNQKILERLDAQEQRQAERDRNLMLALRETQEAKQQIAASKKKWWKLSK